MNRLEVVQACLDALRGKFYLEIGVRRGETFFRVRARHKMAVDPCPRLPRRAMLASVLRDPRNLRNDYFIMESDLFFAEQGRVLAMRNVDVVFIDGLHTYEQSLRDVRNSLRFLAPNGIIILHDCNPTSETMALPLSELPGGNPGSIPAWSGDVWKTVVHLRSTEPGLEVAVLDCDCGIGLVRRGKARTILNYGIEEISRLQYSQLEAARREFLNLQPPGYLKQFLKPRV